MLVAPFKVVLDANVLFPFSLRDTLLRAAAEGLFQLYWSEEILDETTRNLVATGRMSGEQAERLRAAMTSAFPEASVEGYSQLVSAMPNQEKDRMWLPQQSRSVLRSSSPATCETSRTFRRGSRLSPRMSF